MKTNKEKYYRDLAIMILACDKLIVFLEEVFMSGASIISIDNDENIKYISLIRIIENILEKPEFSDLGVYYKRPMYDLYSNSSFLYSEWENKHNPMLRKFYNTIWEKFGTEGTKVIKKPISKDDFSKEIERCRYEHKTVLNVTLAEHNKIININDYKLSQPHFNSENHQIFEYIHKNPNRKITKEEVERELKLTMTKKFERILADLKFKGVLKDLFFPNISIDAVYFRNPIRKNILVNKELKEEDILSLLK